MLAAIEWSGWWWSAAIYESVKLSSAGEQIEFPIVRSSTAIS